MSRKSLKNEITGKLKSYLEIEILRSPADHPISISRVCQDISCSRTTLYKYGLDELVSKAVQEQISRAKKSGQMIEKDFYKSIIADLRKELAQEKVKVNNLQLRIVLMDANCSRMGIDPEELTQDLVKPVRTMSRAGTVKKAKFR